MPRSLSERVGLRNNIFATNVTNASANAAPSPPKENKAARAAHETIEADGGAEMGVNVR